MSFLTDFLGSTPVSADTNNDEKRQSSNSQTAPVLEAAINLNPNPTKQTDLFIVDDSVLETPSGPAGTTREVEEKILNQDKVSVYVVREGDSLSQIATMFGVSPNTVLWANDLKSAKELKKGQELIILPISGIKYTIKKGDTLKSIAQKYSGDVDEIISFNNLPANYSLSVGDEIIIPDGEVHSSTASSQTSTPVKQTGKVASKGYFIKPTTGIKTQGLHGKNKTAVDIASSIGTPVYAAADGKVIVAKTSGWNGGYGNYIVIEHSNGMQTLYAHLSSVEISAGSKVSQGDLIGKMGSSGNSTGSHLHFEILGTRNWNPFN